jgi:hypothetical protein
MTRHRGDLTIGNKEMARHQGGSIIRNKEIARHRGALIISNEEIARYPEDSCGSNNGCRSFDSARRIARNP